MKKQGQTAPLTARRQLRRSGLVLAWLACPPLQAKERDAPLNAALPRRKPVPPAVIAKKIVMIDPGHDGTDAGATGVQGSQETFRRCWGKPP